MSPRGAELLAKWIFSREVLFGEGLVDDGDVGLRRVVCFDKITTAEKFGAQRREIVGVHVAFRDIVVLSMPGPTQYAHPGCVAPMADGNIGGDADGFDSRQSCDLADDAALKCNGLRSFSIVRRRSVERQRGQVIRAHANVDVKQEVQTLAEQARAD